MAAPRPAAPADGESGLVVLVPTAEAAVGPLRAQLDPWAALGVPPHVTLLSPFVPPARLDADVRRRVAAVAAATDPFDFDLTEVRWFGDDVVWLHPEPVAPFVALTRALVAAFPTYLPYDGAFDVIVPHLTVGAYAPVDRLRTGAEAVAAELPIAGQAAEVALLGRTGTDPFAVLDRFPLGVSR